MVKPTYKEFKDLAAPYLPSEKEVKNIRKGFSRYVTQETFYSEIHTGGYTGGNCWDNSEPHYESAKNSHSWYELDEFLISIGFSFAKFRELEKCIMTYEESVSEYYGNTSDYELKVIHLKDIYACL